MTTPLPPFAFGPPLTTATTQTTASTASTTAPSPTAASPTAASPTAASPTLDTFGLGTSSAIGVEPKTAHEAAALAQRAVASTKQVTTALRADIDSLVVKNEVTLQGLRGTRDALQQQSDKVTYWDVLCANAEVAFTDRSSSVDMLRSNLSRAVVHVDHLSAKNGLWKRSIVDVEAEVAALEAAADALAKVAPAAPNVVALRAQASAVSSLTTLSQNLARQVSLLTDLRAAGGALDVELTGYLATLTQLVVEAEAMLARHQALLLSFIEILTSGNPAQAAEDYLRKEVAARVKAVLADSGLTPEAFADHLLAGRDPAVVQLLRPRMVASFSQMLPPVFSTGELG